MRCSRCGMDNDTDATSCSECGARLATDERTMSFEVPADTTEGEGLDYRPEDVPVLVVKRGPIVGERFSLKGEEVTLGRDPRCDIFLNDITVSRRHARIMITADEVTIVDAGSLNGTYVNRERVDEGILAERDELQIGKFRLVYLPGKPRQGE